MQTDYKKSSRCSFVTSCDGPVWMIGEISKASQWLGRTDDRMDQVSLVVSAQILRELPKNAD
jgi:hypothetical protein